VIDRSSPLVFLGALGLAGVAIGLGIGVHTLVGSPSSTPEATDPPATSTIQMSDDLCELMDQMVAYSDDQNERYGDESYLMDETRWDDPALVVGIHTQGQALLDSIGPITGFLDHGAELTTDAAASAAFDDLSQAEAILLEALGRIALDATSVEQYFEQIFGVWGDADLMATSADADAAMAIVQSYVSETCGRDILVGGLFGDTSSEESGDSGDFEFSTGDTMPTDPEEAAAWTDAEMLGAALEAYYADWTEGDPQATITVTDGSYLLFDSEIGPVTEGNVITAQYADGPDDWCVEVTPNGDSTKTYNYEAFWGIWSGPCSSSQS